MLDFNPAANQPNLPMRSLAIAVALAFGMASAHATIFNVDGIKCTLPAAVKAAGTNAAVGQCPAGGATDTLNLSAAAYTLTAAADGDNGLWPISGAVTINGKPGVGSIISRSKAAATPKFRLFEVNNDGVLTLNHVTVQNGKTDQDGGGILNHGTLTLMNSTVSGNSSALFGGGITSYDADYNDSYDGHLTLINSTVSGNSGEYGGGIYSGDPITLTNSTISGNAATDGGGGISSRGTLRLTNSTVSGNSVTGLRMGDGGGIFSTDTLTLTNSTVSGNRATGSGGGIFSSGYFNNTLTLTNTTVSGNSSVNGGGIYFYGVHYEILTLTNSIIANSKSGGDCLRVGSLFGVDNPITIYKGKNLIEDGRCNVVANGGLQGDPKLGPLLDNGGPTRTHALLTGSIAINAAGDWIKPVQIKDQRGAKRPQGSHRDIGAFELISAAEATLQPVITFFNQKTAAGELLGTGSQADKPQRLAATRQQLLLAGDFIRQTGAANKSKACDQLKNTLRRIDTNLTPDANDYVTGTAGDDLAARVQAIRTDLSCP